MTLIMSKNAEIRDAALELYKPPFRRWYGYILDANNETALDNGGGEKGEGFIARIRGWGRIQYLENPEALQDEVGEIVVDALNDYWQKHSPKSDKQIALRKLLGAINKVTCCHRHGTKIESQYLDALSNAQLDFEREIL